MGYSPRGGKESDTTEQLTHKKRKISILLVIALLPKKKFPEPIFNYRYLNLDINSCKRKSVPFISSAQFSRSVMSDSL